MGSTLSSFSSSITMRSSGLMLAIRIWNALERLAFKSWMSHAAVLSERHDFRWKSITAPRDFAAARAQKSAVC